MQITASNFRHEHISLSLLLVLRFFSSEDISRWPVEQSPP